MPLHDAKPLPTVAERLKQLKPSNDLLEFYRQKIAEFDGEHADLTAKLERYKSTYESQHKQTWTLAQREEEIKELQKALSDMQVYLFQEREHVLRLYAENDRLKILELEDRKKIQQLLGLTQPVESETTFFRDPNTDATLVGARGKAAAAVSSFSKCGRPSPPEALRGSSSSTERASKKKQRGIRREGPRGINGTLPSDALSNRDRVETLLLTVEALKAQLEDKTRLGNEKTAGLMEDRRVREEEFRAAFAREAEKIQEVTDKLHHTQDLLYDSTRDYLELKFEHRTRERAWVEEKERLLARIEELKDDMDQHHTEMSAALAAATAPPLVDNREYRDSGNNAFRPSVLSTSGGTESNDRNGSVDDDGRPTLSDGTLSTTKSVVKRQAEAQESLAEMYREQCIKLEDELCRLKEERSAAREADGGRNKKLIARLALMKSRYEGLEKRRMLEVEGYKNSIKILRKRLTDVEKQLYRLATHWKASSEDVKIMGDLHTTATTSKKLLGELQLLKNKVYEAEQGVRNMSGGK